MALLHDIRIWYQGARERERIKNPLRFRAKIRELFPWYLPLWIFPVVFVALWASGYMPRDKVVVRGLLPVISCFLIFYIPTRKVRLSSKEIILFYKLVPLFIMIVSGIIAAFIYTRFSR